MCIEATWLEKDWVSTVSPWLAVSFFPSCLAVSDWSGSEADSLSLLRLHPFALAVKEARKVGVTYAILCKLDV